MEMNDYQHKAIKTRKSPVKTLPHDPIVSLLGLAGETGELISEYKKQLRDGDSYLLDNNRVSEELGDLLWYIASVADEFGLDLNAVAQQNLNKIRERWGEQPNASIRLFDEGFPENERIPLKFGVTFQPVEIDSHTKMHLIIDGIVVGDPLSDNAYQEDGYRFHDIFHLTCAAYLGWSPVTRKLLNRKRKSDKRIDEVEDGGRATVVEEGICAMIFSYASDHNFLEGVNHIDYGLLRMIKTMTRDFEVSICTHQDWEQTILISYRIWRYLRLQNGGSVMVDLESREISFIED